jgi:pimeloyl-ACP methyl ester carboxylesterase
MTESFARVGELELCYETFGDPGDPGLLLIMGLGTQMVAWHDDLCAELAARGFFVIRYDNRDIGRSTKLTWLRPPTTREIVTRDKRAAGYTIDDMADDAAGLLDALGIARAHVAGASMGGMIAQSLAIRHPERVLSLASIMSNTGARWSGQPSLRLYGSLLRRTPRNRGAFIDYIVRMYRAIGSPGFERDEEDLRRMAGLSFDRGHDPAGAARQLMAVIAATDRRRELGRVRVPTVVIHGTRDKLVAPSGGRATARAIPGARLVRIKGQGHDLPRGAWPQIIDAIVENAARAGEVEPAAA